MDFSKKKYVIFKQEFPKSNIPLHSAYIGYIYKRISDWGFVKMQNSEISEVIEYEKFTCYVQDLHFDEFSKFYTGRRPVLVEKYFRRSCQKKILTERGDRFDTIYVPLEVKMEKIIMSNGNSYVTIS